MSKYFRGGISIFLTSLLVFAVGLMPTKPAQAGIPLWWNGNYKYVQRITIANNSTDKLNAGYTLRGVIDTKALYDAVKIEATANDFRVAYQERHEYGFRWKEIDRDLIPFHDKTIASSDRTELFFKAQADIPANGQDKNYYLFYGNPQAGEPPATGNNVWTFSDGFEAYSPRGTGAVGSLQPSMLWRLMGVTANPSSNPQDNVWNGAVWDNLFSSPPAPVNVHSGLWLVGHNEIWNNSATTIYSSSDSSHDYNAFPSVVRADNGDLVAVFSSGDQHLATTNTDLKFTRSTDDGVTWSTPTTLIDDTTYGVHGSLTRLSSGTLLLVYELSKAPAYGQFLYSRKSTDNGLTWSSSVLMGQISDGNSFRTFMRILYSAKAIENSDGSLEFYAYGQTTGDWTGGGWQLGVYKSTDNADSWGSFRFILSAWSLAMYAAEPNVIKRPDGSYYMIIRTQSGGNEAYYSISTNEGSTWSTPIKLKGMYFEAADLANVTVGGRQALLMTARVIADVNDTGYFYDWGIYWGSARATGLAISYDGGITWNDFSIISYWAGGYPALIQQSSGNLLVLYYEELQTSAEARVMAKSFPLTQLASSTNNDLTTPSMPDCFYFISSTCYGLNISVDTVNKIPIWTVRKQNNDNLEIRYRFKFEGTPTNSTYVELPFRYTDKFTSFFLRLDATQMGLYKYVSGSLSQVGSGVNHNVDIGNTWHELKVQASGSHISGFLDGDEVIKGEDTAISSGIGFGLGIKNITSSLHAHFDDFKYRPFVNPDPTMSFGPEIKRNLEAPAVSHSAPTCVSEGKVTISGQVTDDSEMASLVINGAGNSFDANGNFSTAVQDLKEGKNTIIVKATDIGDFETSIEINVWRYMSFSDSERNGGIKFTTVRGEDFTDEVDNQFIRRALRFGAGAVSDKGSVYQLKQKEIIRRLQEKLQKCFGFYPADSQPNGYFDKTTQKALKDFQYSRGLMFLAGYGGGEAFPQTLSALDDITFSDHRVSVEEVNLCFRWQFDNDIQSSSRGEEVKLLQRRLYAKGFFGGPINGVFNALTSQAVKLYQLVAGIKAKTGQLTAATRRALNDSHN